MSDNEIRAMYDKEIFRLNNKVAELERKLSISERLDMLERFVERAESVDTALEAEIIELREQVQEMFKAIKALGGVK